MNAFTKWIRKNILRHKLCKHCGQQIYWDSSAIYDNSWRHKEGNVWWCKPHSLNNIAEL